MGGKLSPTHRRGHPSDCCQRQKKQPWKANREMKKKQKKVRERENARVILVLRMFQVR